MTWVKYEYDAANRLRTVKKDDVNQTEVQTFQYGSSNARLMALDHSTNQWTIYAAEGGSVMAEYTEFTANTPTWTKSYTYLETRLLSTISSNGIGGEFSEYNHFDTLGIRLKTNQTGNFYEQVTLPFGSALAAETTGEASRRFSMYDRSKITGLDYALNRTYDSKLGRFSQVDPIGISASNLEIPQTLNLFAYCGNDPINHSDPDGLFWKAIGRFFSKIGKAINKILGNIVVRIVILIASAIVSFGLTTIASLGLILGTSIAIPTWLSVASWILSAVSWAGKIATTLDLMGMLLQGKFKELGKTIGLAFIGALFAIVEDAVVNGTLDAWKNGENLLSGAWKGFKKGLKYVKEVLTRKYKDLFIAVYGFFCGPGYGSDTSAGKKDNASPVDTRDAACKRHDELLRDQKALRAAGRSHKTTTYFDLKLIKEMALGTSRPRIMDIAFGSGNRIGDVYGFTVPFAFGIRIAKNRGR